MEYSEQSFLAVDDVLGPGESFARKERAFGAHAPRPRIDRVLHVGQFARGDRARTKCSRRTDPNRRHHLVRREIEHAAGRDRRSERAQCRVVPTVLAHTRPTHLAKTHFNFVGDDGGEDQIFAV